VIDQQNNNTIFRRACRDHESASIQASGFQDKFDERLDGDG